MFLECIFYKIWDTEERRRTHPAFNGTEEEERLDAKVKSKSSFSHLLALARAVLKEATVAAPRHNLVSDVQVRVSLRMV